MPAPFGTGSAEPLLWVVTNTRRCFGFRRIASAPSVVLRTRDRATRVRGFAALGSALTTRAGDTFPTRCARGEWEE